MVQSRRLDQEPAKLRVYKFAAAVIDPLRNAVAALQDKGDHMITMEGEMRRAIAAHVAALETTHNEGRPFPANGAPRYGWRKGKARNR